MMAQKNRQVDATGTVHLITISGVQQIAQCTYFRRLVQVHHNLCMSALCLCPLPSAFCPLPSDLCCLSYVRCHVSSINCPPSPALYRLAALYHMPSIVLENLLSYVVSSLSCFFIPLSSVVCRLYSVVCCLSSVVCCLSSVVSLLIISVVLSSVGCHLSSFIKDHFVNLIAY